ncbi:MAG: glycosyltransferase 87 family protein, partial [Anaerolineaceae bacterium]
MDEFPINYLAAKNWLNENRSPYDLTNGEQITSLVNGEDHLETGRVVDYFRYPVLTTLFIMPFTFLSYVAAKALWMAINCILLISGSILLALSFRQKLPISILIATALFGVLNYYSLHSIITSSLKPLVFLIISLTLYLLCIHQDKFAGFILTIALIEFQMSVFVIIFFLIWAGINKRRYFIRSFWAGLIFELIISLILLPTWPVGWLQSLIMDVSNNGIYSSIISQIIKLSYSQGLWLNLGIHLSLLLGIIVLWITYRSTSRQHFLWVAT